MVTTGKKFAIEVTGGISVLLEGEFTKYIFLLKVSPYVHSKDLKYFFLFGAISPEIWER